jgi:hypothetical protein
MPPQSGVLQQYRPAATAEPAISRVNPGLNRGSAEPAMVSDALTDGW